MTAIEKPFACKTPGCDMTFTNEDHLNCHEKKHNLSFSLDLDLAPKPSIVGSAIVDQTPTPTSFFRNCEEVGLFQDLQHVNPFEETFKKALENTKSIDVHIQNKPGDDSLHTPHIIPIIEGTKVRFRDNIVQACIITQNTIDHINKPEQEEKSHSISHFTYKVNLNSTDNEIGTLDTCRSEHSQNDQAKLDSSDINNCKYRLRAALTKKQNATLHHCDRDTEKIVTFTTTNRPDLLSYKVTLPSRKVKPNTIIKPCTATHGPDEKEKIREINRAAQIRCRNRKKMHYERMIGEINILTSDNKRLCAENILLKDKIVALDKMIIKLLTERSSGGTDEYIEMNNEYEKTERDSTLVNQEHEITSTAKQNPVPYLHDPVVIHNTAEEIDRKTTNTRTLSKSSHNVTEKITRKSPSRFVRRNIRILPKMLCSNTLNLPQNPKLY